MTRRPRTPGARRWLLAIAAVPVLFGALGLLAHPAAASSTTTSAVTTSTTTLSSSTTTLSSSIPQPQPIQVGPSGTTTPTTPVPGSGGQVSGGSQPSPGLFDITGHIEAAIGYALAALAPLLVGGF